MKVRVNAEIREIEDQLAKARSELDGATNGKKWLNWLKTFGQEITDLDAKSEEQKKAYIEGLVTIPSDVLRDLSIANKQKSRLTMRRIALLIETGDSAVMDLIDKLCKIKPVKATA